MDVWHAVSQFKACNGVPKYETFAHPPISAQARPFFMQVPIAFLPWGDGRSMIALARKERQLATCRCGLVLAGIYCLLPNPNVLQVPVALKVMDRAQLVEQQDDVQNEVRVMNHLQSRGVDVPLNNSHVIRWEYGEDPHNLYIATEFISNGSLLTYAHGRIRQLMINHLQNFVTKHGANPSKLECVAYVYRAAGHEWMAEGLKIFEGLMEGLTFLHAQNVAHLDLDIYNVAIDKMLVPRIIDLGSSQIADHRHYVGMGHVGIKCKPTFVAPEVRAHARIPPPRPGFHGMQADLWSAGVILVQCVVWGFRGGPNYLSKTPSWRKEVFSHIDATCDSETCHFCLNFISIPPLVGVLIKQLLHIDPTQRISAYDVVMALRDQPQLSFERKSQAAGGNSRAPTMVQDAMNFASSLLDS